MKYLYLYSGEQAAFILSGVCVLPVGVVVTVEGEDHKKLAKNKFVEHLLETGELTITETEEPKSTGTRSGRGGKGSKPAETAPDANSELDDVRAALKDLGIMYADDETLEQLQAKLTQATE